MIKCNEEIVRKFLFISPMKVILNINERNNIASKIIFYSNTQQKIVYNILNSMEKAGLIVREQEKKHIRKIKLTEKGKEVQRLILETVNILDENGQSR